MTDYSYLPTDRVFGRVEKELRRHAEILLPKGYHEIYRKFEQVHIFGIDCQAYEIKSLLDILKRLKD